MVKTIVRTGFAAGVMAGFLTACSGGHSPPIVTDPGVTVRPTTSPAEQIERAQVSAALAQVTNIDRAGLLSRYPTGFTTTLGYDPSAAANLPLIQSSQLALDTAETQILGRNGFVISDRLRYPGFVYGYDTIYS